MKIVFSSQAWDDYLHWQRTDRKVLARINGLIKEITRTPHEGTGKPEPLRHALATAPNQVWSWDITKLLGPAKWTYFQTL